MKEKSLTPKISITIEESLLEEVDRKKREMAFVEGKNLTRSTYISYLLRLALNKEREEVS